MKKSVAIIGGGPASMLLAAHLNTDFFEVTIYEKNGTLGRKLLVAGKGGFNLTHSEELENFILRYTPSSFLKDALQYFSNKDLRVWLETIGISTFIGSSKRVFPVKGIKPVEVLNAILDVLSSNGVTIKTNYTWLGWNDNNELTFNNELVIKPDITVFGLGGASWKKTGSDGGWTDFFKERGVSIVPFQGSNCAYNIDWKPSFIAKAEGKPIKNITITCNGKTEIGEVMITRFGLEGGAIYALSPFIREQIRSNGKAIITIDLKPSLTVKAITDGWESTNFTRQLKTKLKLEKPKIDLLKTYLSKDQFLDVTILADSIKSFSLEIVGAAPIDEAISTVGGIDLKEVNSSFELKKIPTNYVIGEMLDYDAPTGGYLLQSCFSMGVFLANKLNTIV